MSLLAYVWVPVRPIGRERVSAGGMLAPVGAGQGDGQPGVGSGV